MLYHITVTGFMVIPRVGHTVITLKMWIKHNLRFLKMKFLKDKFADISFSL